MKSKKILTILMSAVLFTGTLCGCTQQNDDGRVKISIGNSPIEGQNGYEQFAEKLESFREKYPEIEINPDTYSYDTKNFIAKAAGGQLPTTYATYFTEIKQIASQGYCADISKVVEKVGLLDVINPDILELVKGENGEIWGLPHGAYAQSLNINKKLFKEAGLVNEDGSVKIPQTYDDVLEFAKIIKEKTGKAGFVIPTVENCGGWHMMNIAWSYGTEFMKQNEDGSWSATFDSDEFKNACQWLYDMKWENDGLYENSVVSNGDRIQIFGTYQAGMMFGAPPEQELVTKYGMDRNDIICVRMPEGPGGRFTQSGGAVHMFSNKATEEEIEACLKWFMDTQGWSLVVDEETLKSSEENLIQQSERGEIILSRGVFPTFVNRGNEEKLTALKEKYCNVDMNDWNDYLDFNDITVKPEEPVCCQQLYSVIDGVVQKIITNKDVDIDAVVKEAVNDFQKNYLDNLQ